MPGKQDLQREHFEIDETKVRSAASPFYHSVEKQPNPNYVNQKNTESLAYNTLHGRDERNQEYQQLNLEKFFLLIEPEKNTEESSIHFLKILF